MAAEKVTVMVLKVDLQCPSCYKKTKRTLCKFPQVRDQIYDEKGNTVTITVVCCSPEKVRDKLCCSGGRAIKSIEIKGSSKPKEPEKKEAEKPKQAEKPKDQDKPKATEKKVTIVEPNKPKEAAAKPKEMEKPKPDGAKENKENNKPKANGPPPAAAEKPAEKPKEAQPAAKPAGGPGPVMVPLPAQQMKGPEPVLAQGVPSVFPYVGPSYDGYAGPYYHGYGFPAPPPQPCYEGYYGHGQAQGYGYGYGNGNGYGYGRIANVNRNDHYFSEEEPQTCSIM